MGLLTIECFESMKRLFLKRLAVRNISHGEPRHWDACYKQH